MTLSAEVIPKPGEVYSGHARDGSRRLSTREHKVTSPAFRIYIIIAHDATGYLSSDQLSADIVKSET
jgi:hypothetical protein